jgi:hypothetical protein
MIEPANSKRYIMHLSSMGNGTPDRLLSTRSGAEGELMIEVEVGEMRETKVGAILRLILRSGWCMRLR